MSLAWIREIDQAMARILLTEPDQAIREFISGILTEFGHDVVSSENIVEAEVWLATSPIDVLVTDLVLRGEEGGMLSRSCSALGIPTVTLTGRDFLPDQASRPLPLLEKPFRFSDLQRVLHAIDTARSAAAIRRPRISAA
jgi:DNA-binding NtrC family response regulator